MDDPLRVAVLGLGTMGAGMARSLGRKGHRVALWNRTRSRADELARGIPGSAAAATPAEAVRDADFAVTMLSDPAALLEVVEGPRGVAAGIRNDAVLIDSSTVSPAASLQAARRLREKGAHLLDAPVFGSKNEAEKGELGFMVGGDPAVFERAKPLLVGTLGKSARLMGPNGAGSTAKLVWNLVVAVSLEAWNEGISLAAKAGIDPALMYETFLGGRAKSGIMEMKAPQVLKRDFSPFFALKLLEKDLDLALDAAHALKVPMPALAATKQVVTACMGYGLAEEDFSTTIKFFERVTGCEIKPRTS
jgi:3-hydroxyisobutyrate dehydrogenase-like beta-hydroxyacid dehydrogenase